MIHSGHGKAVDWWSLGALMYDMLTGAVSFIIYFLLRYLLFYNFPFNSNLYYIYKEISIIDK